MLDTKSVQASSIFIKIISFCFSCKICKNPDRLLVSSAVDMSLTIIRSWKPGNSFWIAWQPLQVSGSTGYLYDVHLYV